MNKEKIVDFSMCKTCEHFSKDEREYPCCDCLNIPSRIDSHTPEYYDEAAQNEQRKVAKKSSIITKRG